MKGVSTYPPGILELCYMFYDSASRPSVGMENSLSLRAKVSPICGERALSRDPYKPKDPHIEDFFEWPSQK